MRADSGSHPGITSTFEYQNRQVILHGLVGDHISTTINHTRSFYELPMLECIGGLTLGGTVVDVGANIGNHSVYFGLFTGADKVLAFEPYPLVARLLRENIIANGLRGRIEHRDYALGATTGRVGIRPGPAHNRGHTKVVDGSDVMQRRLDDIVGDEDVSLMKVDVEGNELQVLQGATGLISNQRPHLFVEASNALRRYRLDKFLGRYDYQRVARFDGVVRFPSLARLTAVPTYFYTPAS